MKFFIFTCVYILRRINLLWRTKLAFFLIRSQFPAARDSLWPKSSGTFTQPLVALLSALLLRRMNGVAKKPFQVRPKWHSKVAQRIGLNSSDVTRLVTTEQIRNNYSLLKSRSVLIAVIVIANLLTLSLSIQITAQFNRKCGFLD